MSKRKRIAHSCMPTNLGSGTYIIYWLLLDRFNVPEIVWGIFWTLVILMALSSIMTIVKTDYIDIFKEENA